MNDAKPSKSARKREQLALQSLGEKLIPLEPAELERLPLGEALLEAVTRARSIRSHGALRRQRQLIGKLMREADAGSIESSLERLGQRDKLEKAAFREAEQWRDRLLVEGVSALSDFPARDGTDERNLAKLLGEFNAARSEPVRRRISREVYRAVYKGLAATKEATKE